MFEKTSVLYGFFHTVSSEIAIDVGNMCTAPIMADKGVSKFVQSSKNIIHEDSDGENEMNNAAPVPKSSEIKNIMKRMRRYLDVHSNDEIYNKIDGSKHFVNI
ncbi:hypothetical protein TNCV_349541 [Trichonephila clavipes]|nr:hypothetical protein TNCV_349541 [Trichonephila clavipes]